VQQSCGVFWKVLDKAADFIGREREKAVRPDYYACWAKG